MLGVKLNQEVIERHHGGPARGTEVPASRCPAKPIL
jgi:hypothetical protein